MPVSECIQGNAQTLTKKSGCTLPWHWTLLDNATADDFKICPKDKFLDQSNDSVRNYLEYDCNQPRHCEGMVVSFTLLREVGRSQCQLIKYSQIIYLKIK